MELTVAEYITAEEANFKTVRVPITNSKDWNMAEYIERCTNVSNGWFHSGTNDGLRPYADIVTPIKNVAFRSEGFDVKDIVPYVNDATNYYKSFLVKKFHPKWARRNEIDTFIDDLVETSVVYDLALIKRGKERPEVVKLQTIAFCDQTEIMSGPICLKHQYSISELLNLKGKWDDEKIDEAILMAKNVKTVKTANDKEAKTPGKYIEVYELHGSFPKNWEKDGGSPDEYTNQLHIITFYAPVEGGDKVSIELFNGKSEELSDIFKALVINKVYGRACGKSWIELLFEPQVWTNYSAIKIKKMLDAAAVNLLQTASEDLGNQKLDNLKNNTIIKHDEGNPVTHLNSPPANLPALANYQMKQESDARVLGSATDAQLGVNPPAGTPFALQSLVVQQGQGIHEYRQGKIATFVSDVLYRDWILEILVTEMNKGDEWLDELTLDEMQYVAEAVSTQQANQEAVKLSIKYFDKEGKAPTQEEIDTFKEVVKTNFMKGGNKRFLKIVKDELKDIPIDVFINIKQKQKDMSKNADSITNILRTVMSNPQAFQQMPGIGKAFNELIENSGLSPVDFSGMITPPAQPPQPQEQAQMQPQQPQLAPQV